MDSVIKGIIGAAALHTVTNASYKVMYALILSCSMPLAQNRSRLLRTYQLLMSSTKLWRALAASGI